MELERIRKRPKEYVGANLADYDECARTFSWTQARALLDRLPGGGLNIAHEAIDRHVKAGRGGKLALRWLGRDDSVRDFTYAAPSFCEITAVASESVLPSASRRAQVYPPWRSGTKARIAGGLLSEGGLTR